jgi:hypothetical protein
MDSAENLIPDYAKFLTFVIEVEAANSTTFSDQIGLYFQFKLNGFSLMRIAKDSMIICIQMLLINAIQQIVALN